MSNTNDTATVTTGVKSHAKTPNPKDLFGNKKVSLTKLPAIGSIMGAMAMMDGAEKYGPYNWRDKPVIASIYVDAARRHLDAWFEGQEKADDSSVHHLGHAIACCAIILDAQATNCLVDDRPVTVGLNPSWLSDMMVRLQDDIAARRAKQEQAKKV